LRASFYFTFAHQKAKHQLQEPAAAL